jgi:hypothetical protein
MTCHLRVSAPIGATNTLNASSSPAANRRRMWRIILSSGLEARKKWRDFGGTGANSGDRGAGKGAGVPRSQKARCRSILGERRTRNVACWLCDSVIRSSH